MHQDAGKPENRRSWLRASISISVAAALAGAFLIVPILGCGCTYKTRAQVAEGLNLAAACRASR